MMIMSHNDDDCGDFKAKQILSVFLEYLVEQSLLVQHEYKRPPNCCSNQSTKEKKFFGEKWWQNQYIFDTMAGSKFARACVFFTFITLLAKTESLKASSCLFATPRIFWVDIGNRYVMYQLAANMQRTGDG